MDINKCSHCDRKSYKKWAPKEWRLRFWHTLKDSVYLERCSECGKLYRLSWCQNIAYFLLFVALTLVFFIITIIPIIGGLLAIGFFLWMYPTVFEIPRRYLPWVEKTEGLYYARWRSKWGFIAAHYFGFVIGTYISAVLIDEVLVRLF